MPTGVPRIPEPWEWLRTRVCLTCGERKPWARFGVHERNQDGTVKYVRAHCGPCCVAKDRERQRAWRERNRERDRAYKREKARQRRAAMRADRSGRGGSLLPKGPFVAWVNDRVREVGTMMDLAECIGVDDRSIRRVCTDQKHVTVTFADRCLTAMGWHLHEVYPEEQAA